MVTIQAALAFSTDILTMEGVPGCLQASDVAYQIDPDVTQPTMLVHQTVM
jgi:hypothetical protein